MKTISVVFIASVMLVLAGCSSPDPVVVSEENPWVIEDKTAPESVDPPEPKEQSDKRVIFEPGELSWAKPTHRVIFHLLPEAAETKALPGLRSYAELPNNDPASYETEVGGVHHQLQFSSTLHHVGRSRDGLESSSVNWSRFRGVYFPQPQLGEQPPTLHMFEQAREEDHIVIYKAGDKFVQLGAGTLFRVHIPRATAEGEWLKCQHYSKSKATNGASKDNPCSTPTAEDTVYEQVFLFGEDPSIQHGRDIFIVSDHAKESLWRLPRGEDGLPIGSSDESERERLGTLTFYINRNWAQFQY